MASQETSKFSRGTRQFWPGKLGSTRDNQDKIGSNMFYLARFNKHAGQQMFEPFCACLSLVEQVCLSKLFGSTCDLLVSCATKREVVHIFCDPARFSKRAGSKHV